MRVEDYNALPANLPMSTVVRALFEVVKTLALSGEFLPRGKLASVVDEMARTYMEELPVAYKASFLDSFELIKEIFLARPPTSEDEDVIKLATYNLKQMEEKLELDQDRFREVFFKKIEEDLGESLVNLVMLFDRAIRSLG